MDNFGLISILPPLLAIILCFMTKQVLVSLFIGIIVGTTVLSGMNPIAGSIMFLDFTIANVSDSWNATMLLFAFSMGGFVGLIKYSGGAEGFANLLTRRLKSPEGIQAGAGLLGTLFFFEDISNTAIVGNTFRPLTDRLNISREKLAYIVDSTSAPVCSLSVVSTWIAYQVGLINTQIQGTEIADSAYSIFIKSIPYSFYSIFAIFLVFSIALTGRDYGPMLKAEHRARTTGDVAGAKSGEMSGEFKQLEGVSPRAVNMIVPILVLVGTALAGMWWTGGGADGVALAEAINASDSMTALLWGGIAGIITCIAMYSIQKIGNLEQLVNACVEGMHVMVYANLILILAWALGTVSDELGTANFIISTVENIISPGILPLIIFMASGVISFMIGTSWGTMAIVTPIAVPLSISLDIPVHITISGILSGSVMGDHCSPISDTTVLSSMFSGCNHIEHVRTQIPYALTSSAIAILGYLMLSLGVPIAIVLPLGLLLVIACIVIFSKASAKRYGIQVPLSKHNKTNQR